MKILQIFGAVVAVHLLAFIFIFASPGCQSGPRNIPTPDATLPGSGAAVAPVTYSTSVASPTPVDLGTSGSPVVTYSPASPSGQSRPTRPGSPAAAAVVPAKPTADVTPVSTYMVGRGDSLWSIAKKNGLTVSELAKANNLSTGVALKPGQKLMIPGKAPAATAAPKDLAVAAPAAGKPAAGKPATVAAHPNADAVTYTVMAGDSFSTIAKKFQVKTSDLYAANSITNPSQMLRAGQVLVIPGFKAVGTKPPVGSKPAAATETPATAASVTPHFEIAAPPPGQDLDAGLKGTSTEVPTIKVETPKTEEPPKK